MFGLCRPQLCSLALALVWLVVGCDADAEPTNGSALAEVLNSLPPPVLAFGPDRSFHGQFLQPGGEASYEIPQLFLTCIDNERVEAEVDEELVVAACSRITVTFEVSVGQLTYLLSDPAWLNSELQSENASSEVSGSTAFIEVAQLLLSNETQLILPGLNFSWEAEDCRKLVHFTATVEDGLHEAWQQTTYINIPPCPQFEVMWDAAPLQLDEDAEANLTGLSIVTTDSSIFLDVEIKHPDEALGDCRVEYWRDEVIPFVAGRECHLDGTAAELVEKFSNVIYRPPQDFFGLLQLEVKVRERSLRDVALGIDNPLQSQTFMLDVLVDGVNDAPVIHLSQELQVVEEDAGPLTLESIFLTDIDAREDPLDLGIEVVEGAMGGGLQMCHIDTVLVQEPQNYRVDTPCAVERAQKMVLRGTVYDLNLLFGGPRSQLTFAPDQDWHGAVALNVSVNDLGSGLGTEKAQMTWRMLYIMVEPTADTPELGFTCTSPLVALDTSRLMVRNCIDLSPGADASAQGLFMAVLIEASEEEAHLYIGNLGRVRIRGEGSALIHISGLFKHMREALRELAVELPESLSPELDDPEGRRLSIDVTAVSLGETFDDLDTEDLSEWPNTTMSFPVVFRRDSPVVLPWPEPPAPPEIPEVLPIEEPQVRDIIPELPHLAEPPIILICPPAVDLLEGEENVLIGRNISVLDTDIPAGTDDGTVEVEAEFSIDTGFLHLFPLGSPAEVAVSVTEVSDTYAKLEASMDGVRQVLEVLTFTPSQDIYHGVVHFHFKLLHLNSSRVVECDVGLVVHPVNTPPVITVDTGAISLPLPLSADVSLHGLLRLSDPDEEDFFGWFADRTHSSRLSLQVSCGSLSIGHYSDYDFVNGVQSGSTAGVEGLTFNFGDGFEDRHINITSTTKHLNWQLRRLYYHSHGCGGVDTVLAVELDDLGNFGVGGPSNAGGPLQDHVEVILSVDSNVQPQTLDNYREPGPRRIKGDLGRGYYESEVPEL
mmetsp:Transcript_54156/g.128937  ORF Transcript_54156/g.128937 Transcript_54156/m.128937 type:complete len:994 (-) Transcript_54156:152-3133(-)